MDDADNAPPRGEMGLYRIRASVGQGLVYIGQGKVRERLRARWRVEIGRLASEEGAREVAGRLECSWTLDPAWLQNQRLELENDLIAAYVLVAGEAPLEQFEERQV
jgi:hypothetical protein